ncbi:MULTISPECIES: ABC transporter substrate-binding protein [unclassified Bartonella]|uniref:ABC transporter substrate-binding protein n=1 Tax=unclassified Bartonella TaxID=2645622 RepID=UPI0015FA5E1D|nr:MULTISPECIES: ABC transporter substrate-binding protein [unclassified Bartonella]UXN05859.1 ABC transporter substrate-binding protein [Bartonella sp. HY761]
MNFVQKICAAAVLGWSAFGFTPAQSTELTMYYPVAVGGPLTNVMDDFVKRFEKENPDIKINAVYSGNYFETMTKVMTVVKGGQPPQLSVLLSTDVFTLLEEDAIVPFDDISGEDSKDWFDKFYPAFMANGNIDGKTWSIPFQRSTIVLYYNKDAFREVGLDPEQPPKTWDEMTEYAQKLVKKDNSGNVTRWGVKIPSTFGYWMLQALAIENDHELMNKNGNEVYFNDNKTVEALNYWLDLSKTYNASPKGNIEWGTLRSDFLEQNTAMMWHTTGNLTAVKEGAKFDFGVAMLPEKVRRGSPTGGGNFYVFKKASPEQQAAAVKFIKWMTTPERAAEWSMKSGYVATRPDAYDTKELKAYSEEFPVTLVARDQLAYAVPELSVYENGRIYKIINDAIQAVLTGNQSAKDGLDKAQSQAERILKPYK